MGGVRRGPSGCAASDMFEIIGEGPGPAQSIGSPFCRVATSARVARGTRPWPLQRSTWKTSESGGRCVIAIHLKRRIRNQPAIQNTRPRSAGKRAAVSAARHHVLRLLITWVGESNRSGCRSARYGTETESRLACSEFTRFEVDEALKRRLELPRVVIACRSSGGRADETMDWGFAVGRTRRRRRRERKATLI